MGGREPPIGIESISFYLFSFPGMVHNQHLMLFVPWESLKKAKNEFHPIRTYTDLKKRKKPWE
jgi:hypothetical protein